MKDKVDEQGMEVYYCPTHLMLVDFSTKPLPGSLYESFRKIIDVLLQDSSFLIKERVDNHSICQVVSYNSVKTNGKEKYTGATKSQTNRQKTYVDVIKTQTNRQKTCTDVATLQSKRTGDSR